MYLARHDLSLQLRSGEYLCVVGESGSGKSMQAKAAITDAAELQSGRLVFREQDLANLSETAMRQLRRHSIQRSALKR